MAAAPDGIVETGAPSFVVLGPEGMGLSGAPTDLHLLPDGRVFVVSQHEIAFSDGVRWDVFRAAEGQPSMTSVAVDRDGQIYAGIQGAFGRVELGENARWSLSPVVKLPDDARFGNSTMNAVTSVGDEWYWYGGGGAAVAWRPGQKPRVAGDIATVGRIFTVGSSVFISEQSSGRLFRATAENTLERLRAAPEVGSETVTCAVPFASGQVLVGTHMAGLKLFDGVTFQPFPTSALLGPGRRIADLCIVGDGLFAAAVDTIGIVFFDRQGRAIQVLSRTLDHRLAHVQQLDFATDGVLWAVLNGGVARVEFPSPVSRFEPLLASGLIYAKPVRHRGKLWVLADGTARRGVYDDDGRLERFELDSPPGRYVFTISDVDGDLLAANEVGIFAYENGAWRLVLPGIVNARMGVARTTAAGSLYVARGEFGFIQRNAEGFSVRRFPKPELGNNYNGVQDTAGIVWFELGSSGAARVDLSGPEPKLEIIGRAEGLADGWVEIYLFEGIVRFHLPNRVFRFDERARRFVHDEGLLRRFPQFDRAAGRPITDPLGRVWYMSDGNVHVIEGVSSSRPTQKTFSVGFAPVEFTVEENGVVWMFGHRHLARLDTRITPPPPAPLRALITSVHFSATNRQIVHPGAALEPIAHADNSFVIHFAAPANPFATPAMFEFMLEGAGKQWVPTRNVGSAVFNRLKEGRYSFRVRPVTAAGAAGKEARLDFVVRPPWFRTPLAWTLYFLGALGFVGIAVWISSYLQRRENARLEHLVTERTRELNRQIEETTKKTVALSASEERYRTLNADLEHRVQERTAQLSSSNEELAQRESLFRLIFEQAPVGISWKRADLGDTYHFNSTFRRILDLPADVAADRKTLTALVHPDDAARHAEMQRLIDSGASDSYNLEERFVLEGNRCVWSSLSAAVVRDEAGRIVQEIGILEDITARKKAEADLANTYKDLVDASRMAGMAEVATGVLHNVGNVLNSLNVSAGVIASRTRQSQVDKLVKLSALLDEQAHDLGAFMAHDSRGKQVPNFLKLVTQQALQERTWLQQETASMQKNIDHIKEIVAMQQGYTRVAGVIETLDPTALFEDALNMSSAGQAAAQVGILREFQPVPKISVEKGKLLQILVNLIRNAKFACADALEKGDTSEKFVVARLELAGDRVRFIVRDNGVGIPAENITRIFEHGFTTRRYGHGFGLHSSALAAREMKGSLSAFSDGPGRGAMFTLELPLTLEAESSGVGLGTAGKRHSVATSKSRSDTPHVANVASSAGPLEVISLSR